MDFNPFSLKGKHILVVGASSGIGKATAIACSKLGAELTIISRNMAKLRDVSSGLTGTEQHKVYGCDICNDEEVKSFVGKIDKVDGVVFCAGILKTVPVRFIHRKDIDEVFNTNYYGIVGVCTQLIAQKKLNKFSSLVFISSLTANYLFEYGNAVYSSSKAAILAYSKVLAKELSKRHVRVNSVLPGMVKTEILKQSDIPEDQFNKDEENYPLGYGEPDDIAYACIYLLSDASKWVTGSSLVMDGGLTIR